MSILCGKDRIEISEISYVTIEKIRYYELGKLEEEYHGDHPDSLNSLLRESRRTSLGIYSYSPSTNSKFCQKLEDALKKYWYEIGLALPSPKPKNRISDNWTFAAKKKSTFSLGTISEDGDASVTWKFQTDYGFNAVNYHVFGYSQTTLSLANDIIPILRQLLQIKHKANSKSQTTSDFLSLLFEVAIHPSDALYHDDRRETPQEMHTELKALLDEYDNVYGKIRTEKIKNQARMKQREEFLQKYEGKSVLVLSLNGVRRKYLEYYCGFDIFAKKVEIDNALALYRKQKSDRIQSEKAVLIEQITAEFNADNLLSDAKLSNQGKLEAYSKVRKFCSKYIPSLNDRNFDICSIHPDYASARSCTSFKENWNRLSRIYSILNRGISGEDKVFEVLTLFDDRIRILRDFIWGYEHDYIVISPYGIFTIEVKTLRGNYVLTETGMLKCLSTNKVTPKDVALQSKKHLETLRRNLGACPAFSSRVPLQEIICSAEPNFTIKDDYRQLPVCYYNTLDKYLLPKNGKIVLSEKEMQAIEEYLLQHKQPDFTYDVFLPAGEIDSRSEFITSFAEVASGYIIAQRDSQNK